MRAHGVGKKISRYVTNFDSSPGIYGGPIFI